MLKNILIPEKINNYFIFPQTILGFEITKNHVYCIKINISGKSELKIEKFYEESLNLNNGTTYLEKVTNAIKKIADNNKAITYIKVCFPSYLVIYKELTVPFIDSSKIRSILDFEIEPILPFPIEEAITDFIVTKQDLKKKETTILVTVARKKDIQELIEPFKLAGINPTNVIVDTIGLYGLLKSFKFLKENETVALIDIESNYMNIVYIQENQLKIIRSIQINLNKSTNDLVSTISFTLNSFKTLVPFFSEIKNLILIGQENKIKELSESIQEQINVNPVIFNIKTIKENLPNSAILPLSVAYPTTTSENFNLLRKELESSDIGLLKKQILVSILLIILIIISLFTFSYFQIKKTKNEVTKSRNEVISTLKNRFNITDSSILKNLSEAIRTANNKVNEEESIWYAFSNKTKFSYLKYLQELSTIVDREAIGLNLKKLTISENVITLEGEVKDFKSLEILENELNESKLFGHVSVPQETKFTIKITIKKNDENN